MNRQVLQQGGALAALCAGLTISLAAGNAAAQQSAQPGADADNNRANDNRANDNRDVVVVTAQRREQNLQDVPIAITSFSETDIRIQRIDELQDYLLKSPNIGFQENGNRNRAQFGIRGVTNVGGDTNVVGVYVDEFNIAPSSSSRTFDVNLFDIERIEVLRGPQGTFFGRNALGGALNITTKAPSTEEFSGEVVGEYGSFDHRLGRLSVNAPITDRLAVRLSGYYEANDGFIENVGPSGGSNAREDNGLRAAVRATPTDNWTMDAAYSRVDYRQDFDDLVNNGRFLTLQLEGYVGAANSLAPLTGAPLLPIDAAGGFTPQNTRRISNDVASNSQNVTEIITLRNVVEFGEYALTSVTGYIDSEYNQTRDGDRSPLPFVFVDIGTEVRSFSQELRLNGPVMDNGFFTLGAIYSDDERKSRAIQSIGDDDVFFPLFALNGIEEGVFTDIFDVFTTESFAVFGQFEWAFTDRLSVNLGGRYTRDTVSTTGIRTGQSFIDTDLPTEENDFSDFSPSAVVTYALTDDVNTYASFKRAYKPGGVRATTEGPEVFAEETAWTYELGVKSSLFDGRLTANAALFYIDWQDLQVSARDPLSLASRILNAATAENYGVEFEARALATDSLSFDFGVGYLESSFGDFGNAVAEGGETFDATGNTLPFAPKWSLSVGGQYDYDLSSRIDGFFRIEYVYKGDQFGDVQNTTPGGQPFLLPTGDTVFVVDRFIPRYGLVNLRAGLSFDRIEASISAENLLDNEFIVGGSASAIVLGGNTDAIGTPRNVIGRLSVSF